MIRRTNRSTIRATRTLRRNVLMGIIGLTMSACGLTDDVSDPPSDPSPLTKTTTEVPDVVTEPSTKMSREVTALKEELERLRDKLAVAENIAPPTLQSTPKSQPSHGSAESTGPKPGKLTTYKVKGDLGVVGSAMALGVDKRVPLGVSNSFSTDAGKVWAFIKVKNKTAPTKLRMVWKRDGKERMAIDLRVGKSSGWRTWSYKRMGKRDAGQWTVDVLSPEGETLHTMAFEITDGKNQTDLANR